MKNHTFNPVPIILIVDDCNVTKSIIKHPLEKKLYKVITANDPIEAFSILKDNNVDIIFSDINMSNMNGIEFTKRLKLDRRYRNIPVLIVSNSESNKDFSLSLKEGAVDFIRKPFIVDEVVLKCDIHLKQSSYIKKIKSQSKELEEYKRVLSESDIISKSDINGNITYVNNKFLEISGYTEKELIGKPHNIVRHPDMSKEVFKGMWKTIQNKETFKSIIKNRKKDGSSYYVDATIVPILDVNGDIKEYIGVRHDITDIMNPKKQFLDDISTSTNQPICILSKILNYKLLKEFYGESFIQKIEDYISKNIVKFLPDNLKIKKSYHVDNGSFAFILNKELDETIEDTYGSFASEIELSLTKFQNNLHKYDFIIEEEKIDIDFIFSFSTKKEDAFENLKLGICKAEEDGIDIVYANKLVDKNKTKARDNMKISHMLKRAIEGGNAKLISHFQPVMNNNTNVIEKYESLIRLINEDGNVVSPFFFIDIAKKAGYYKSITNIVLENMVEALGETDKEITVNLSTIDIEDIDIRKKLLDIISIPEYYGRIVFELLEDEVAKDFDIVKDFISLSKVIGGVKIAIDDFGSGYSNFERLLDFQPDILKIDASLIKNIVNDAFSQHVVEAIILFAKKENIQTVAEFISDGDILEKVKSMGIDYSQGFYIGKPGPLPNN